MDKSVVEAHSELYHYTTAAGLQGILESQQLWATNIAYLNDAEEHTGFFDRRLPHLLEQPIRDVVEKAASVHNDIDVEGTVQDERTHLCDCIRDLTIRFNDPYVTSFCSTSRQDVRNNGLLSQWRGYGLDGGYAIVLATEGLQRLLDEEAKSFGYQFLYWGDVEYYDQDTIEKALHSETMDRERIVKETIGQICERTLHNPSALDWSVCAPLYEPTAILACCHKHRGFREEAEVRIVAAPWNAEVREENRKHGNSLPVKRVHFATKNGVHVPYIKLFGQQSNGNASKLPITKVIVGPHPDRLKRRKAVELLLEQYGTEAEVTVSDIPYLGR